MTTETLNETRQFYLTELLNNMMRTQPMGFHEANEIRASGIYFVYQAETLFFIGVTKRSLKTRLNELASDFRKHTLNRKLLRKLIVKMCNMDIPPLIGTSRDDLANEKVLTKSKFDFLQTCVNVRVKNNLTFRFMELSIKDARELKELAIEKLMPKMNG